MTPSEQTIQTLPQLGARAGHVDLAVTEGDFVSVMGPSGSAKSTLMSIWSPLVIAAAVGVCVTIAVAFGVYPALSAARMDPVLALQSEQFPLAPPAR